MTISPQNIQWPSGFGYIVGDRGTQALGAKEVVQAIPDTIVASENFEGVITGSGTWFVDTTNPHSGLKYLRSAIIGNSASTTHTFTVPALATTLRFWYRISSELNFDFLKIYKNSISAPNQLFSTSGTANVWTQLSLPLAGVTSVIFEYSKDSSSIGGLDLAGIDDLEWISVLGVAAVTNYEPFHLDANNCLKVSLCSNHVIIDSLPAIEIMNDIGNPVPVSFTRLNCATDSIEICNDAGSPISVSGTVELGVTTLAALETITVLQGTNPWVVSGTVTVSNFPAVNHLDCATDSVTICPGDDPIEVTVNNFPVVEHLDCATDSVTICPGDDPIEVTVNNFPAVEHLDCTTDSVEVCQSTSPWIVSGTAFDIRALNCLTDSIEICNDIGSPITVSVTNIPHVVVDSIPEVEIKNDIGNPIPVSFTRLNCATDSIEICNDVGSPITVNVSNIPHVIVDSIPEVEIKNDTGNPVPVSFTRLNCTTDSIEICNDVGNPIPVSGSVSVSNIPHVIVDSIPEVEIKNDTGNPVPVSFTRLSCATDSVEICNDVGNPIPVSGSISISNIPHVIVDSIPEVEIKNDSGNPIPVSFTRLNCTTDSIEICNDAGSPITVSVTNIPHVIVDSIPEVEIKNDSGNPVPISFTRLSCATDSIEICNDVGNPIPVSGTVTVNNFPAVAHLACATDKVGACQEGIWNVGITGTVVPGKRSLLGLYYATAGPIDYTTAADTATGGDLWLVNTSNTVVVYLRSVRFTAILDSLAILTNLPTIRMERMTFTGTPSGTLVTPAKRDSTDATNTGTVRTAATGMTITAGAAIESFSPPTADVIGGLLAVNATASIPVEQLFVGDLDSFITLRQNEGIVFRQSTAGNATENRQYWLNFVWEEI